MLNWFKRKPKPATEARRNSADSDVESNPPTYNIGGITVVGHRLHLRNKEVVEKLAELLLNHADKLEFGERIRLADRDPYVVGYLAGIIDAVTQNGGVTDNYQRTGMLERLYATTFSRGMQSGAMDWFLEQQDTNTVLQEAMLSGGDDYLAFVNNEIRTFGALFRYMKREPSSTDISSVHGHSR